MQLTILSSLLVATAFLSASVAGKKTTAEEAVKAYTDLLKDAKPAVDASKVPFINLGLIIDIYNTIEDIAAKLENCGIGKGSSSGSSTSGSDGSTATFLSELLSFREKFGNVPGMDVFFKEIINRKLNGESSSSSTGSLTNLVIPFNLEGSISQGQIRTQPIVATIPGGTAQQFFYPTSGSQGGQWVISQTQGPTGPRGQVPFPTGPNGQVPFPTGPNGQVPFPTGPNGQVPFPSGPNGQTGTIGGEGSINNGGYVTAPSGYVTSNRK